MLAVYELGRLPGIGNRTAQRLAFHLLRASPEDAHALADAIRDVKERIGLCEVCFNLAEGPRCTICTDERRDVGLICVVEEGRRFDRTRARSRRGDNVWPLAPSAPREHRGRSRGDRP